ncbi:MAG: HIT family protein [Clostridia bacterium]|nr:HIT family protein [Clostridia bacterium]
MTDCLFCNWKNDKEKIIIENELAFATYDEFAVSKGHTLFITKRHVKDFFETTAEERQALFDLIDQVKEIVDEKYHPTGYNIGMNCGKSAGQTVMHLHVHLIPRYDGDVENPRGGIRGVIPQKQNY